MFLRLTRPFVGGQLSLPFQKCDVRRYGNVSEKVVETLKGIVGAENVSQTESIRSHHSVDESYHKAILPELVLFPRSTEQVSECARVCYDQSIHMIPFGTGTGLEGGILPIHGGVTFNLTKMDQVVCVHAEDFDATVEPGITRKGFNNYLRDLGLWFPVDPGADASLCGMAATSASGTNAVRYGTMRENVLNLEVVLADGRVIDTAGKGKRSRKTAAGYNLTNLFVGSEGTLGFITKATVRLYGIPEATVAAICHFPNIKAAVETTVAVLQSCIPVARIEFLDEVQMRASIQYSKLEGLLEQPTLFLEFNGSETAVEEQAKAVRDISLSFGGADFKWAKEQSERNKLWSARHNAFYASLALRPQSKAIVTDVAVPISHLPDILMATKDDIIKSGLLATIVGHVGDGNFHSMLILDPDDKAELEKAKQVADRIAERAISMDGTCTGEHGIGIGKRRFLPKQLGDVNLDIMRSIKSVLDPKNLMNSGKVV